MIGALYDWSRVPVYGAFGLTNRETAFDHIAEYYAYTGQNMVGWPVVSNNNWGFKCKIPAWGIGDKHDELSGALNACDQRGVKFVATFELGQGFNMGGVKYSDETKEEYKQKMLEGFKQFFDRYGKHESLYAIAFGMPDFGPPYGRATIDMIRELFDGDISQFCNTIKSYHPDIKIYTFVGAQDLHKQYFSNAWDIINRWEQTGESWPGYLADEVNKLWKKWQRDPEELLNVEGLNVAHQYQPDDHAIYDEYSQQPRAMFYYDVDTSRAKSDLLSTPSAMIWNTFFEAWFGLHPDNFWYRKLWVAPDFNPAPPYAMSSYARVISHRDRNFIIAGAWNNKPGGQEASIRQFAKAYRALPPSALSEVTVGGTTPVQVRAGIYNSTGYASIINNTPFNCQITLMADGQRQEVQIKPFALETLVFQNIPDSWSVAAFGHAPAEYINWLRDRLIEYESLLAEVRELNIQAAGAAYTAVAERARRLFDTQQYQKMDEELGFGLTSELALRKQILNPPQIVVPKIESPAIERYINDWSDGTTDIVIDQGKYLAAHIYFPNAWTGPADLSVRMRLAHGGENLYISVKINDSKSSQKDQVNLFFSPENYLKWQEQNLDYELSYETPRTAISDKEQGVDDQTPDSYPGSYTASMVIPLSDIDPNGLGKTGFVLQVVDEDDQGNTYPKAKWARKQTMIYPHQPSFAYYSDARTCGQLVFE